MSSSPASAIAMRQNESRLRKFGVRTADTKSRRTTTCDACWTNRSIDAVTFATPNHWHSLCAIWGCQAGKDVYVEKPGSHNILKGGKMVEAARKYDRIVQHGTQCRSSPNIVEGIENFMPA